VQEKYKFYYNGYNNYNSYQIVYRWNSHSGIDLVLNWIMHR